MKPKNLRAITRVRIAQLLEGEIERLSEQGHMAKDIAECIVIVETERILNEMKGM